MTRRSGAGIAPKSLASFGSGTLLLLDHFAMLIGIDHEGGKAPKLSVEAGCQDALASIEDVQIPFRITNDHQLK